MKEQEEIKRKKEDIGELGRTKGERKERKYGRIGAKERKRKKKGTGEQ